MSTPDPPTPLPMITRQRTSRLNIPNSSKPMMTPEQWQEDQNRKQAQHAESFRAAKHEEELRLKAARERRRAAGIKTRSETIDQTEEIPVAEAVMMAREEEEQKQAILPSRGPKTDGGSTVIDEGEVPIVRGRTKRVTKVEAARARAAELAKKKKKHRRVIG